MFDQRFAEAAVGEMFVLPMLCDRSDAAFTKTIERAIIRAGLTPWPRLWHNLRACRQTDLTRKPGIGPAAVRYWMGNSKMVAERHYERVVADDWAVAVGPNADYPNFQRRKFRNRVIPPNLAIVVVPPRPPFDLPVADSG